MTLKDKLMERLQNAKKQQPVESSQEIWNLISEEFDSFTGMELAEGSKPLACVDVELWGNQLLITKYVSGGPFEGSIQKTARITLSNAAKEKIDGIMSEVVMFAKSEGVNTERYEEDEEYLAWAFDVSLN